jgi:branched-chain amino acid transport system substrate-binding protein
LILCVVCSALLFVACRVPGAVRPTAKIGLVAPFEGRYRYVGYDLFPAVRMAVREANAAGGIEGVFVELVAYDDAADPAVAVQQAQKLAVDPDVVAVIGHFRDGTTAAAVPSYVEANLPLLAPAVLDPDLGSGNDVVFRFGSDASAVAAAMLEGVGAAALVTDGGVLGQALLDGASERGISLAPVVSPGTPGWVDTIKRAGLATVICATDPVAAGEVAMALHTGGWEGTLLGGPSLGAEDFVAVGADAAQGALFVTPWLPFEATEEGFVAAYTSISGGPRPGRLTLPAYQAAGLLLEALRLDVAAHQTPSRAGMAAALAELVTSWPAADGAIYRYRIGATGAPEPVSSDMSQSVWAGPVF